jgi:hypothetical protein
MVESLNIFERVAETIKEEQSAAFINGPASTKYFSICHTTEPKDIGQHYPQTREIDISAAHSLKFDHLPPNSIDFGFIHIHKGSKLTDFLSTAAFAGHAFILSSKAIKVFEQFDLGKYKIHPATVLHNGKRYDYGVLQFTNDFHSELDFTNSHFYVANILGGYEFEIDVESLEDYEFKSNEVKKGLYLGTKRWWYVRLKSGTFSSNTHTPDLFTVFSSSIGPFISPKLAEAFIENRLTGVKIERVYNLRD